MASRAVETSRRASTATPDGARTEVAVMTSRLPGMAVHAAFSAGPASHGSLLVVRAVRRGDGEPARVAVVAGRKLGGAVQRNRAKRRLRAAVVQTRLPDGFDFVLIARSDALAAPFAALAAEVELVAARAASHAADVGAGRV